MIKYLKEYRFYIILFLFLLIPVITIDTSTRAPRDYRFYDRVIVTLTAPVQITISWLFDQTVSGFQNYIYLWNTRRDNIALLDENRRLLNAIASLRESEQENIRLKKLLQFEEKFNLDSIVARVVAKDVSTDFRAIRINRGERSGVKKNMAVITNEGIVGRVLRTTAHTADVVTILDLLSAVDAIVERSRARGVVEGLTDDTCQLRYALRTDDIQIGDILVSGALGGVFPKGIPIGVVSKVERKPYGITQAVDVRPSVDFSRLEEVMVITRAGSDVFPVDPFAGGSELIMAPPVPASATKTKGAPQ
ncbi:MAG: rod shape-determining protein MreC [Bdellovibrionales bacterium GWB1_55_8]|nr:MAG: rod shape-determining protein MreC [Bdellovibrionales bacterium GWB1_55_8]